MLTLEATFVIIVIWGSVLVSAWFLAKYMFSVYSVKKTSLDDLGPSNFQCTENMVAAQ